MSVLFLTLSVVAALIMRVLNIVCAVVLVELLGAMWALEIVPFTGTESKTSQYEEERKTFHEPPW